MEDNSLDGYRLFPVGLERLTRAALQDLGLDAKSMDRCKNFFALGMCYWLYNRSMDLTYKWIEDKFKTKALLVEANKLAMRAGYNYCEATEAFQVSYEIPPAKLTPGTYRNLSGNQALAIGFVAASQKAGLPLFLGSYPITPASDILHELSMYKNFGVMTFQAEDEIAAITSAIGAAYSGALALTTTSGPGMALKTEAMGLAVATELPLVICDIQRGGPSTGLPTKTEQADLLQAMFGRNSEAPIPVLAPSTPGDCFWVAVEACRIALKYMVPVIILSDGYLANGAEPWRIPKVEEVPGIKVSFATEPNGFHPYSRNPETLARPWAIPGTPGLEHRIGGIEKQDGTGNINYEPLNHEKMVRLRAAKVEAVGQDIPDLVPAGDPDGDLLDRGLGLDVWCHHRGHEDHARQGAPHRPRPSASSQPTGPQPGRTPGTLPPCAGSGDEPRATPDALARQVPGGRAGLQQDSGTALQAIRNRSEDRRNSELSFLDGSEPERILGEKDQ